MFELPKADPEAKEQMVQLLMTGDMNREQAVKHVDASVAILDNVMSTMLSTFNTQMLMLNCDPILLMSLVAKGMDGTAKTIMSMMAAMAQEDDARRGEDCKCFACNLEREIGRPLTAEEHSEVKRIKKIADTNRDAELTAVKAMYANLGVAYDG